MSSDNELGSDLVIALKETGNSKLLLELFTLRTAKWKSPYMYVEGGTIGLFSDFENFEKKYIAYELIPSAIDIVLAQDDPNLLATALSLILACITESDTAEVPNELINKHDRIKRLVLKLENRESLLQWRQICEWYRQEDWKI